MAEGGNISYQPTDGLSYDPAQEKYWDPRALDKEIRRVFEVCHGCRLCFKFCDTFPDLFSLIDNKYDGDVRKISAEETGKIFDTCFQCKLCEVNCPYTPRDQHPYQLDFPKLVHRHRAGRDARPRGAPARPCPRGPGHYGPDGAGQPRAGQRRQSHPPESLADGEGHRRPPPQAAPRIRFQHLRALGPADRADGGAGRRVRGRALPDLFRSAQRAGDREGHDLGAREERRPRALCRGTALLRHAGVGKGRPLVAAGARHARISASCCRSSRKGPRCSSSIPPAR